LQAKLPQPATSVRAKQAAQERPVEESTSEPDSASESDSESETAAEEEPGEYHSTLQWIKPGQLSEQVGVSISVLRRWANSGAVRTLVSEGGHRLFNVASVVAYIEQQATDSSAGGRSHVSQDDAKGSDVVVLVRLPDSAGTLAKKHNDKAPLSDAHKTSTRMREAAKLIHQQLRSAFPSSKLIIELPEVPVEEFHHRNSLNRLHTYFTKRQVSKLIIGSTQDISKNSVAYKLFEWMCAKHDVTIKIVPNLYTLS
jgi:phage terminase Nu1 subunit (DNA packaging protein)